MAERHELELFAVRTRTGGFQLITEEGMVVVEAASWRGLRADLEAVLARSSGPPLKVTILVGRPQPKTGGRELQGAARSEKPRRTWSEAGQLDCAGR